MRFITAAVADRIRGRRFARGLFAEVASLAFVIAAFVMICGTFAPVLRHDWTWSPGSQGLRSLLEQTTSAWNPSGFGSLSPYQPNLLFAAILWFGAFTGDVDVTYTTYLAVLALLCVLCLRRALTLLDTGVTTRFVLCCIFLFNPWTYTEVVAGHLFMVLAVALLVWLCTSATVGSLNPTTATLLLASLLPQIQFFLICCAYLSIVAVRKKRWFLVPAVALCTLPLLVTIVGNWSSLVTTLRTLPWLKSQSVDPAKAFFLLGYFAQYTEPAQAAFTAAMVAFLGAVVIGIAASRCRGAALAVLLIAILVTLFATGLEGPFAVVMALLFERFPEVGVYRELYDVLGVTLGLYVVVAALALRYSRSAQAVAAVSAAGLVVIWLHYSPRSFWVPLAQVPQTHVEAQPSSRFALFPAFQPLAFNGRGSGVDPDAFGRGNQVYPINETFPNYPVQRALASYSISGTSTDLAALSVATIVVRPYFKSAEALGPTSKHAQTLRAPHLTPYPEVSIGDLPSPSSLNRELAAGGVFYADITDALGARSPALSRARRGTATPVRPSIETLDPAVGWIDARLMFTRRPELAQAHGGVYTEGSTRALPVHGPLLLAWLDGELIDQHGRTLARGTRRGFAWIPVPLGVSQVYCRGRCLIALEGQPTDAVPLEPARHATPHGVPFRALVPWFIVVSIPASSVPILRYNSRYEASWTAILDGRRLPHFRIDTIANAWVLPEASDQPKARTVLLVELTAAAQSAAYVVLILAIVFLTLRTRRINGVRNCALDSRALQLSRPTVTPR